MVRDGAATAFRLDLMKSGLTGYVFLNLDGTAYFDDTFVREPGDLIDEVGPSLFKVTPGKMEPVPTWTAAAMRGLALDFAEHVIPYWTDADHQELYEALRRARGSTLVPKLWADQIARRGAAEGVKAMSAHTNADQSIPQRVNFGIQARLHANTYTAQAVVGALKTGGPVTLARVIRNARLAAANFESAKVDELKVGKHAPEIATVISEGHLRGEDVERTWQSDHLVTKIGLV